MDLSGAKSEYYTYTAKASDVGRQLALGGIAVVWLLHGEKHNLTFEKNLLIPLAGFCLSLALDFLQYLVCSAIWGIYRRYKEKSLHAGGNLKDEFLAPIAINWPGIALFWLKAACLIFGAVTLGNFIAEKIVTS